MENYQKLEKIGEGVYLPLLLSFHFLSLLYHGQD